MHHFAAAHQDDNNNNNVPHSHTCACDAADFGFTINCADTNLMLSSIPLLQKYNCSNDCTSTVCRKNYSILQSHHDFCLPNGLPALVQKGIHLYEDACEECLITRQPDPSLPDCPLVQDCNDGTGMLAYNELLVNGCLDPAICQSSSVCGDHFVILQAVYDTCHEDSLEIFAEQGFHDFQVACVNRGCNVGNIGTAQLLCEDPAAATTTAATSSAGTLMTMMMTTTTRTKSVAAFLIGSTIIPSIVGSVILLF